MPKDTVPPRLGRRFHRFWGGYVASNLADGVLLTALPLMAVAVTDDPLLVSGLTAMWYLPWLFFGLHAGALADRLDRARLMVGANLLRGVLLVALLGVVAVYGVQLWALYAAMFLLVCCETVYDSAGRGIVPELVPRAQLGTANSRIEGGRTVAEGFVAAPAASFAVAVAPVLPLAVNAVAYLASALVMPKRVAGDGGETEDERESEHVKRAGGARGAAADCVSGAAAPGPARPRRPLRYDIHEGLEFVWSNRVQRGLFMTTVLVGLAGTMINAVIVLFAVQLLKIPEVWYGTLITVMAVGAVSGAMVAERVVARFGRPRTLVAGYLFLGAVTALMAVVPHPATAAVGLFGNGLAASIINITLITITQAITPMSIMSRAISVRRVFGRGVGPVAAVTAGLLARVDLRLPILVAGVVAIVVGIAFRHHFVRASHMADEAVR